METRVYDCPDCGAPLPPAADGEHVTCAACGKPAVIESGGAAVLREQRSRAEAEALFAKLGRPPSWSQRVAVRLIDWRLWLFGLPVMVVVLLRISALPRTAIEAAWEAARHERLAHVASPPEAWLLAVG